MGKINWTDKSVAHLKAIHDYIAEDSPLYPSNFIKALIKATDKLQTFPMCGSMVPEFEYSTLHLREVTIMDIELFIGSMLNKILK